MARTERNDHSREKDHSQLDRKKAESFRKIKEAELKGVSFWCHMREQQIGGPICTKVQSTSGCTAGADNCPLWDTKANRKAETTPGTTRKTTSGKLSYQAIMKAHFLEAGSASLEELVDLINNHPSRKNIERQADNKNVSVGVSILKNPKRVKNPLAIDFSRKTKTYYCLEVDGMKEMLVRDEADYDKVKADHHDNKKKDTPDPAPKTEPPSTPVAADTWTTLTLKQLKAKAKKAKIKGYSSMTKPKLIAALTA